MSRGEVGEGVSREVVGRKGIACNQSQKFCLTLFAHKQGAIMQFDWLLARQSKNCLSCIIPHPEHNKIKIDMAESEEMLVFEFSVFQLIYMQRIDIEDITQWREDWNFIFEWQNNILRTSAASA